jgi:hypothetical protein
MALVGSPSDHQLPITQEVIKPMGEKQGDARKYETEYRVGEPPNSDVLKKTSLSQKFSKVLEIF